MHEVASRELRNNTRSLLDRVDRGETIVITVDGRPAAALTPIANRSRWISRADFITRVLPHQADAELSRELADLAGDTTDDLPFR
ncbi:MAG: type II toxin-antitoxin system Phd/YefM family antitoxin [Acidimicrobiales bacterium]